MRLQHNLGGIQSTWKEVSLSPFKMEVLETLLLEILKSRNAPPDVPVVSWWAIPYMPPDVLSASQKDVPPLCQMHLVVHLFRAVAIVPLNPKNPHASRRLLQLTTMDFSGVAVLIRGLNRLHVLQG
ncbi:unnamed protein product [Caretta caretta]